MSLFHYFRARPAQHTFCILHCLPLALFLTAVFSPFGTWSGNLFIWMTALQMVLLWGGMALYIRKTDRLRQLTDSPEVNIRRGKKVGARIKQHEKAQLMWEVLQDDDVLREQLNTSWSYLVRIISRSVTFTPVALVLCAGAGAWLLRTVSAYKILHDKVIVSDGWHTEVGSFNFSRATDRSNSENVLVVWDDPVVAQKYLNHWTSRWEQGTDWKQTY